VLSQSVYLIAAVLTEPRGLASRAAAASASTPWGGLVTAVASTETSECSARGAVVSECGSGSECSATPWLGLVPPPLGAAVNALGDPETVSCNQMLGVR
jgi:hypothetical protein